MRYASVIAAATLGLSLTANAQPRQFHAKGQHRCWASEVIGYKCTVEGWKFSDCNEAGLKLKKVNCCSSYIFNKKKVTNASSKGFVMQSCSIFR